MVIDVKREDGEKLIGSGKAVFMSTEESRHFKSEEGLEATDQYSAGNSETEVVSEESTDAEVSIEPEVVSEESTDAEVSVEPEVVSEESTDAEVSLKPEVVSEESTDAEVSIEPEVVSEEDQIVKTHKIERISNYKSPLVLDILAF